MASSCLMINSPDCSFVHGASILSTLSVNERKKMCLKGVEVYQTFLKFLQWKGRVLYPFYKPRFFAFLRYEAKNLWHLKE